jgi:hypothetical protein
VSSLSRNGIVTRVNVTQPRAIDTFMSDFLSLVLDHGCHLTLIMVRPATHALALATILLLQSWSALAQFNFFDQMFGGHPGHQQQQQRPGDGAAHYASQADSGGSNVAQDAGCLLPQLTTQTVPCSQYLCPDTLVCVKHPAECPCPDVQDVKCVVTDPVEKGAATRLCVRGQNECAQVEGLLSAYAK